MTQLKDLSEKEDAKKSMIERIKMVMWPIGDLVAGLIIALYLAVMYSAIIDGAVVFSNIVLCHMSPNQETPLNIIEETAAYAKGLKDSYVIPINGKWDTDYVVYNNIGTKEAKKSDADYIKEIEKETGIRLECWDIHDNNVCDSYSQEKEGRIISIIFNGERMNYYSRYMNTPALIYNFMRAVFYFKQHEVKIQKDYGEQFSSLISDFIKSPDVPSFYYSLIKKSSETASELKILHYTMDHIGSKFFDTELTLVWYLPKAENTQCWDLNKNNICDDNEDMSGDGDCNAFDCVNL
jgi:hypothetical protein